MRVPPAVPPGAAGAPLVVKGTLLADAVWHGTVEVADDLRVPAGTTLRVLAGTRVLVRPADTTKTDPEYLDNATEILVRGRLIVEGTAEQPVVFEPLPGTPRESPEASAWGGIIFDRGTGDMHGCRIVGAETGVTFLASSPSLADVVVEDAEAGIAVHPGSSPRLHRVKVTARETGIFVLPGSTPELDGVNAVGNDLEGLLVAPGAAPRIRDCSFKGGVSDILWGDAAEPPAGLGGMRLRRVALPPAERPPIPGMPFPPLVPPPGARPDRLYRGENFIGEDTTWEGEVLIDGTVMVSRVARLSIAPGTVVRFAFRDSNGDGIGESEIFIQGQLAAGGTAARPIVFAAAEGHGPGRWGAINLMGSDEAESLLSWCLVQDGYRGLHSHFSRFRAEHCVFRDNYRSLQFQESKAAVADCFITGSASGMRFRDSTAVLEGLVVAGNTLGVQIFRSTFSLVRSVVADNALAGVHAREVEGVISGCLIAGNAPGLRASEGRLRIEGNRIVGNSVGGLRLRRTEARVEGNRIASNSGNAVSTDSPGAVFRANGIEGNLRFAVGNSSAAAVDAAGNWWGTPVPTSDAFFDADDDPRLGRVVTGGALASAPALP